MGFGSFMGHRLLGIFLALLGVASFFMIFISFAGGKTFNSSMLMAGLFAVLTIVLLVAGKYFMRTEH